MCISNLARFRWHRVPPVTACFLMALSVTALGQTPAPGSPSGSAEPVFGNVHFDFTGRLQETYDDNVVNAVTGNASSDEVTNFVGGLGFTYGSQHNRFNIVWTPNLGVYAHNSSYNYFTQGITGSWSDQLTQGLSVAWSINGYRFPTRASVPLVTSDTSGNVFSTGLLLESGQVLTGGSTSFNVSDRLSELNTVSVAVTGTMLRYSNDTSVNNGAGASLNLGSSSVTTATGGATLSWTHQFTERVNMGVAASGNVGNYEVGVGRSHYYAVSPTFHWQISNSDSVTMAIGPAQYDNPGSKPVFGYYANGAITHAQSQRAVFSLVWNRFDQQSQINGGYINNILAASGGYQADPLKFSFSVGYTELSTLGGDHAWGIFGGPTVSWPVSRYFSLDVNYSRIQQEQTGTALSAFVYHRDRYMIEMMFSNAAKRGAGR